MSTVSPYDFLKALTVVLGVAAVTTVVFQRLKQPVILGYLLAGLIVGPNLPIPVVANHDVVRLLSELGVILLMFSLGLEFSLRKLVAVGAVAGLTALLETSVMVWLGFSVGRLFGWSATQSVFTGAIVAISSTTIIAKAFEENGVRGRLRELVVGVLVVEDLIAILLMAVLTPLGSGAELKAIDLALTTGRLLAFLVGLVAIGLLVVPRAMRAIVRLGKPETITVASVGLCFAVALLAHTFGYSVALGAFIAGSLVSESGEEKQISHLVEPVRDVFAAIFFVSVGMLIDPRLIASQWLLVLALAVTVVVGKILSVSLGAFFTGNGVRTSVQAGMSLAQIGEFSFIIAGLGLSLGATGEVLYPAAVAVSAVTTLTTPWLIRASGPVAAFVDRKLPHPLQTFAALYGSWLQNLRSAPRKKTPGRSMRRLFALMTLDAGLLALLIIGTSLGAGSAIAFLPIGPAVGAFVVYGAAALLALPFCVGVVRIARRLGIELAEQALPRSKGGKVDLAAAPRRMLLVALQLGSLLAVGVPLVAVTQPFLPGFHGAGLLLLLVMALSVAFWKRAANLEGHVLAGAQAIVEALAKQTHVKDELAEIHALLPGIGEPVPLKLEPSSPSVGKSLAELNLRGVTGATVIAIRRSAGDVLVPTAREVLQAGDTLALGGTHEAIDAAKVLLG